MRFKQIATPCYSSTLRKSLPEETWWVNVAQRQRTNVKKKISQMRAHIATPIVFARYGYYKNHTRKINMVCVCVCKCIYVVYILKAFIKCTRTLTLQTHTHTHTREIILWLYKNNFASSQRRCVHMSDFLLDILFHQ